MSEPRYFKYDENQPYPLQMLNYVKGTFYNDALTVLKQIGEDENIYKFLINYYQNVLHRISYGHTQEEVEAIIQTCVLDTHICYEWSKYKQVYKFNKELFELLTQNTDSDNVMASVFLHKLPFKCFFVENKIVADNGNEYVGFYVLLRQGIDDKPELYIEFSQADEERSFIYCALPLNEGENKSINELLTQKYLLAGVRPEEVPEKETFCNLCKKAINCIAYLCTDKVDVVKTKREYRQNNQNKKKKPAKVSIGAVGDKTARIMRENRTRYVYETVNNGASGHKGTPKSPHIRKAHYQIYWLGKRTDPNREFIVKLIDPILVKGGPAQTTIRKVSGNT